MATGSGVSLLVRPRSTLDCTRVVSWTALLAGAVSSTAPVTPARLISVPSNDGSVVTTRVMVLVASAARLPMFQMRVAVPVEPGVAA